MGLAGASGGGGSGGGRGGGGGLASLAERLHEDPRSVSDVQAALATDPLDAARELQGRLHDTGSRVQRPFTKPRVSKLASLNFDNLLGPGGGVPASLGGGPIVFGRQRERQQLLLNDLKSSQGKAFVNLDRYLSQRVGVAVLPRTGGGGVSRHNLGSATMTSMSMVAAGGAGSPAARQQQQQHGSLSSPPHHPAHSHASASGGSPPSGGARTRTSTATATTGPPLAGAMDERLVQDTQASDDGDHERRGGKDYGDSRPQTVAAALAAAAALSSPPLSPALLPAQSLMGRNSINTPKGGLDESVSLREGSVSAAAAADQNHFADHAEGRGDNILLEDGRQRTAGQTIGPQLYAWLRDAIRAMQRETIDLVAGHYDTILMDSEEVLDALTASVQGGGGGSPKPGGVGGTAAERALAAADRAGGGGSAMAMGKSKLTIDPDMGGGNLSSSQSGSEMPSPANSPMARSPGGGGGGGGGGSGGRPPRVGSHSPTGADSKSDAWSGPGPRTNNSGEVLGSRTVKAAEGKYALLAKRQGFMAAFHEASTALEAALESHHGRAAEGRREKQEQLFSEVKDAQAHAYVAMDTYMTTHKEDLRIGPEMRGWFQRTVRDMQSNMASLVWSNFEKLSKAVTYADTGAVEEAGLATEAFLDIFTCLSKLQAGREEEGKRNHKAETRDLMGIVNDGKRDRDGLSVRQRLNLEAASSGFDESSSKLKRRIRELEGVLGSVLTLDDGSEGGGGSGAQKLAYLAEHAQLAKANKAILDLADAKNEEIARLTAKVDKLEEANMRLDATNKGNGFAARDYQQRFKDLEALRKNYDSAVKKAGPAGKAAAAQAAAELAAAKAGLGGGDGDSHKAAGLKGEVARLKAEAFRMRAYNTAMERERGALMQMVDALKEQPTMYKRTDRLRERLRTPPRTPPESIDAAALRGHLLSPVELPKTWRSQSTSSLYVFPSESLLPAEMMLEKGEGGAGKKGKGAKKGGKKKK